MKRVLVFRKRMKNVAHGAAALLVSACVGEVSEGPVTLQTFDAQKPDMAHEGGNDGGSDGGSEASIPDSGPDAPHEAGNDAGTGPNTYSYPLSTSQFPPADPNASSSAPAVGALTPGDLPGFTLRRITDNGLRHAYSRRSAWNIDETRYGMNHADIYDASSGAFIAQAPVNSEWMWSNVNPDIIYGCRGNQFVRYNVATGGEEVLATFSAYAAISIGNSEGSLDNQDRFVVLLGDQTKLITFDVQARSVVAGPIATPDPKGTLNWAGISQLGEYVAGQYGGTLFAYDRDLTNFRVLGNGNHGDFCIDNNGEDVFVGLVNETVDVVRFRDNSIHSVSLGAQTGNGHLSCRNILRPGWAYISAYKGAQLFALQIRYDGQTTMEHWGYHRSPIYDYGNYDYNATSKAVASPTGTQLMYTTRWYQTIPVSDFIVSYDQN